MTELAEKLKPQLEQLPAEDRAELAHFLLRTLDEEDAEEKAAWVAELERRVANYESGKGTARPADEVLSELRKKYAT